MIRDTSYGIIPLRRAGGAWQLLLVCHRIGHFWGFPKGHLDAPDETPQAAAARELTEETQLKVDRFLPIAPFEERYQFLHRGELVHKTVYFYPAVVSGTLTVDPIEIEAAEWLSPEEAAARLTYPEAQRLLASFLPHLICEDL